MLGETHLPSPPKLEGYQMKFGDELVRFVWATASFLACDGDLDASWVWEASLWIADDCLPYRRPNLRLILLSAVNS